MLNILRNFDAAEKGEKPSTGAKDVNDMKTILESIQSVQECGMDMPTPAPEVDKVTMNVNLNARGVDAIEELIALMGGNGKDSKDDMELILPMGGKPGPSMGPKEPPMGPKEPSMGDLIRMASDKPKQLSMDDDMDEEWDNAPDETYSDHDKMIHDLSGGINREKKQYAKAQDGDNAMAVEDEHLESLKAQLSADWEQKLKEEDKVRGVQSNGRLVNFNVDKSKPKTTWKKGQDTLTLYATPEEVGAAMKAGDLKGWQKDAASGNPAPQSNAELDADAADNAAPAQQAPAQQAPQSNAELDADAADTGSEDNMDDAANTGQPAAAPAQEKVKPQIGQEYTIQSGDTLGKIAKDSGSNVEAIAKANNISDPNKIKAGQKITIPDPNAAPAQDAAPAPDNRNAAAQAADPDGDGNADDPEAQVFAGDQGNQQAGNDEPGVVDQAVDAVKGAASSAWDTVSGWFGGDDEEQAAGEQPQGTGAAANQGAGQPQGAAGAQDPEAEKKSIEDQIAKLQARMKELEKTQ